jgi:hypothetical protein
MRFSVHTKTNQAPGAARSSTPRGDRGCKVQRRYACFFDGPHGWFINARPFRPAFVLRVGRAAGVPALNPLPASGRGLSPLDRLPFIRQLASTHLPVPARRPCIQRRAPRHPRPTLGPPTPPPRQARHPSQLQSSLPSTHTLRPPSHAPRTHHPRPTLRPPSPILAGEVPVLLAAPDRRPERARQPARRCGGAVRAGGRGA